MFSRALVLLALFALPAAAQTTHVVTLQGFTFSPANLVVQVGDTVQWNWVTGFHDVTSGISSPNGIFSSGTPVSSPNSYSLTFDQPFLDANPVPGNAYDYFCSVHVGLGMSGRVTVECPAQLLPYGSGVNPPASLILGGTPTLGGTFSLSIDNPTMSQALGSFAFLAVANAPDPNFPAGTPLPGFGMSGPFGELLIDLTPPNPIQVITGGVWTGAPVPVNVVVPNDPGLMCRRFYSQGVMFDPTAGVGSPRFALTDAAEVVIGS